MGITPGQGLYFSSDQLPPELWRMISARVAGSRPLATPRAMASAVPIMCTASNWLLHTLATCPAPAGPAWKMFLPMLARIGRARSRVAAAPPTIKVRVPAAAPAVPPETGASSRAMPRAAAARWTLRAASGAMVEHSSTRLPGAITLSRPASPRYNPSTWRLAGSMLITTSAALTASAALLAARAPCAASSSTALATRSNTLRLWPALSRLRAMGRPIWPRPIKAI